MPRQGLTVARGQPGGGQPKPKTRRNGRRRRYYKRKAPRGTAKYLKRKAKKRTVQDKLNAQQKRAVANSKKGTTLMLECSPIGVQTTSLKSLYRMVHAIVACYYPKVNVESIGDPTNSPFLGPGGLAAWLVWCVITAIRKNGSTNDLVPDPNTLPDFNYAYKIPIPLAVFIMAWLRNKGPAYDIYNELPDVSNILGATMSNNITYNATTYSLSVSPYGEMVQPKDPGQNSEILFDSGTTTTFTRAQLIAAGDTWNALISNVGGCVAFERLWRDENGASRIVPYGSPVLLANPVTDGFDCRMKFQEEVAALVIDYSSPGTASDGICLKPYPMANQDRFVLGAVNLLSHCRCPVSTYRKKNWTFPKDIRKIIDPARSAHRWHSYGRIKTLRVNMTTNTTNWYSVQKNICEQICVAYSSTALTNTAALAANEMVYVMQAYIFCHILDWGWQHYTRLGKLITGQFINAVTSGGSEIKSIPVPQNIAELVRQWRPIVVAGQLTIPDCPVVAQSTLANWLSFGTSGVTFSGVNVSPFQNAASPNGYAGLVSVYLGLFSTNILPASNFAAAGYSLNGNSVSNTLFGGAAVSATIQSSTLPIKTANLFIADWKTKFIDVSGQKMFNMEYPILGDVGMVTYADVYTRVTWMFGNGWTSTRFDYTTGQLLIACDKVLAWKGIQYARVVNAAITIIGSGDYYPFKVTITGGDGGVLANVESFAQDDLGVEYNSILTGLESNPKLTDRSMKPWMALDNITSRLYSERGGAAFEEFSTQDAIIAFLVSLHDQSLHMSNYSYSETNNLFAPNSLSGWMSFLSGVEATYNTGKFIFTDIWSTFNKLFGLSKVSLI